MATQQVAKKSPPWFALPNKKRYAPLSSSGSKKRRRELDESVAIDPADDDVLFGRGGFTNSHPGNIKYRAKALELRPRYEASLSKEEKYEISILLIDSVVAEGGRFLEKGKDGLWHEVLYNGARKKASQQLRERLKGTRTKTQASEKRCVNQSSTQQDISDIVECEDDIFCGQVFDNVINDIISEHEPKKKKRRKVDCSLQCSIEGCTRKAADSGTCKTDHGGYYHCKQEGCTNKAVQGGVCSRHGASALRKTCIHEGCTSLARGKERVCTKHGAKKQIRPNKKNIAIKRVGSPSKFKSPISTKRLVNQFTAGGGRPKAVPLIECSIEGCTRKAADSGTCWKHKGYNHCKHEGCTNKRVKGGVCLKHGTKKKTPNKKKSATPSKSLSKRRIVNQFTAGGGGGTGGTTPTRATVLTPGTVRTPASAIAVRDASDDNDDNDGMPVDDNLSQIDEPAFDTYSEYHWETLNQVTDVAEGYHHITINLDGAITQTGLRFAYSSKLLRAVVTEILNGCPFADQIKVGKECVLKNKYLYSSN